MKVNRFFVFFLICLLCELANIQLQAQNWERTFGGPAIEYGSAAVQTSDSGFIAVGSTTSFGAGSWDVYLLKTDAGGDTLWTKTFGGFSGDKGFSVQQAIDGGYILGGVTEGSGTQDIYLIKTDTSGIVEWTKIIDSGGTEQCSEVVQTRDSGYCLAGIINNTGTGNTDVYLVRTDPDGDTLWTKTYGTSSLDIGYSLQQTFDNGFIISGATYNASASHYDAFLVRTNSMGDTLWTRIYYGSSSGYGNSVVQTSDSGYILGGTSAENFFAVKTDVNGTTQWTKEIDKGGGDRCASVIQSMDGGYVMAGYTYSFSSDADVLLIKLDSNGDEQWSKKYGGSLWDEASMIRPVVNGGYIIAGTSNSDIYLIRTDCVNFPSASVAVLDTICNGDSLGSTLVTQLQTDVTYQWMKDDSVLTGAVSPNYAAFEDGAYTVLITDSNGCSNESEATDIYFPRPYFQAYPHEVCPGDQVIMGNWNFGADYYPFYDWNFGDGVTDTGAVVNHVYQDTGIYIITRTVRTLNGSCHAFLDSVSVTHSALPPVDFDLLVNSQNMFNNTACPGDRIECIPYAYTYLFVPLPFFNAAAYQWDFGDGTTDTVLYPVHYYSTYGNFTITFTVTNHCGNTESTSLTILIDSTLNTSANFDWTDVQQVSNDTVNACEEIRFQSEGGLTYEWNFGDGTTLTTTADTNSHIFTSVGNYPVQLIATNGCGRSDTLNRTVIVWGICTGIHSPMVNGNDVVIYPHPVVGQATLEISLSAKNASLRHFDFLIYDLQGRLVEQISINKLKFVIGRDKLMNGMYFYKLNSGNETLATGKFVVQ